MATLRQLVKLLVAVSSLLLALAVPVAPAGAQTTCRISDFRRPDGTLDIQAYLACIAGLGREQEQEEQQPPPQQLPVTGSETGQLLALGIGLIVMGVAAKIGSAKLAGRKELEEVAV